MNATNTNTAVNAILVVGAGFAIYKILDKFFGNPHKEHEQDLENAINTLPNPNPAQMSFTVARAKILANNLEHAMRRSPVLSADLDGTDEDAIYEVFDEIKNRADMIAVYKAFGIRVYTDTLFTPAVKYDLVGMLKKELNTSEWNKIKTKIGWLS